MMQPGRALLAPALAGTLALLAGCAPVSPWERGHLAKPQMALQPHPLQAAFQEHAYGAREAASGGAASSGGGGCGCY